MSRRPAPLPRAAILLALLLNVAACVSVRFVGDYDGEIDKGISQVLAQLQSIFTRMERTAGTDGALYRNYVKDYDEIRTELRVLHARAAAHVKNDLTVQQIDLLLDSLTTLEDLHRLGPIPIEQQAVLRRGIETSCTAILKLELAKKRSDSGS